MVTNVETMTNHTDRPRGVTCETELLAMARYARRLEANETARKAREGVPDEEMLAKRSKSREGFGVAGTMARLFSGPEGES